MERLGTVLNLILTGCNTSKSNNNVVIVLLALHSSIRQSVKAPDLFTINIVIVIGV